MKVHFTNIMTLSCLIIIAFFCTANNLYSQNNKNNTLKISIQQSAISGTDYIDCSYVLQNGILTVVGTKEYYSDTSRYIKTDTVIKKKLPKKQLDSLSFIMDEINKKTFDSIYNSKYFILAGISWNFDLSYKNKVVKTTLISFYLPEMDKLIMFLNNKLPKEKQLISFDILDVKEVSLKKKMHL